MNPYPYDHDFDAEWWDHEIDTDTGLRYDLAWAWKSLCSRIKARLTPVEICIECAKPAYRWGKPVGNHADCLPF